MTTFQHQNKNVRQTFLIFILFTGLTSVVGYALSYFFGNGVFLFGAAIMSLIQGAVGYFAGESMALAHAGGKRVAVEDNPQLFNMVEDLSRIAGIPMPDLYVSPDPSMNAFACGRGPGRASICVNQGLLNTLNKPELEGVLAHEISHIKNKDTLTMTMAMVMSSIIAAICDLGVRSQMFGGGMFGGGNNDRESNGQSSWVMFIPVVITLFVAPMIASLLTFAVSRSREYLADASAVEITRYPEGLISALQKISGNPVATDRYSTSMNHFYISEPKQYFGEESKDGWFSTHPNVQNRIKALKDQGQIQ
ncbi:MAG: M48 family metallopeptidase [Patescibacteria group bacterium]